MFNKITESDIEELRGICGAESVIEDISDDYSRDEAGIIMQLPDILIKVDSTDTISAVMMLANKRRLPVTVRGAGTGLSCAATATSGGIMLETTGMDKILELDKDNLTVTVQPGVLLMDLAEFTAEHGFLYPPDPGEKTATIGGNISTNAGGMRAVKYGVTRDYVYGLTVVMPDGRILKLGGKVVKNSSGYSLKDLIIGSEGTLAIITEAILKLIPLPTVSISMLTPFDTLEKALEAVPVIIRSKTVPTAIEFMSKETIRCAEDYLGRRFPGIRHPAYLLLTFDGSVREQVEKEFAEVAELCIDLGAEDVFIADTDERKDSIWKNRGVFYEAIKSSTDELESCDIVVPRSNLVEFIEYSHQVIKKVGIRMPYFGHAGDGNLHIYLCRDGMENKLWQSMAEQVLDLLFAKAAELGGLPSGEHGIGCMKKKYLLDIVGVDQIDLMSGIKKVFDPNGILNPGKVFD